MTIEHEQTTTRISATAADGRSVGLACARPPRVRPDGPARPIKILHLHGRMVRAGAEMRTMEIFRHVDRREFQFNFCAVSGCSAEFDEEIRDLGGEVYFLCRRDLSFQRRFRQLLLTHRFDVVHSHLHHISGSLLRTAAHCGVPVRVAHFRSSQADQVDGLGRKLYRLAWRLWVDRYATDTVMRRWIDRYATDILGVSHSTLDKAWRPDWQSDPRCQVVYDGLDLSGFNVLADPIGVRSEFGLPAGSPLYIHVGRMTEAKNHPRLISIFAEVLQRDPAARLLIVGRRDRRIEGELRRRMAALKIEGQIIIAGERPDVPRLLKAADLLIFPSRWEGLGDVVLEACAAGTPTLASDLPSIREISALLPGVCYLPLEASDAAWGQAAVSLSATSKPGIDPQAALRHFRESVFTVQHCAETLCQLWQRAAATAPTGGVADG